MAVLILPTMWPVPAQDRPTAQTSTDVLVGYTIELDNVQVTFDLKYTNYGFRGNSAPPGHRFLWITYTTLNMGSSPVIDPLGRKYGLRVQFDTMEEQVLNIGMDRELLPGDPLGGGTVLTIPLTANLVALLVFSVATSEVILTIPVVGR